MQRYKKTLSIFEFFLLNLLFGKYLEEKAGFLLVVFVF